jgi:outer membrane protein TolC
MRPAIAGCTAFSKTELLYAGAVAGNRRVVELSNELYLIGLGKFLNVLDAERVLYSSESDLAQREGYRVLRCGRALSVAWGAARAPR